MQTIAKTNDKTPLGNKSLKGKENSIDSVVQRWLHQNKKQQHVDEKISDRRDKNYFFADSISFSGILQQVIPIKITFCKWKLKTKDSVATKHGTEKQSYNSPLTTYEQQFFASSCPLIVFFKKAIIIWSFYRANIGHKLAVRQFMDW